MRLRALKTLSTAIAVPALAITGSAFSQDRLRTFADVQLDASLAAIDGAIAEAEANVDSNREQLAALRSRRAEMVAAADDLRNFPFNPFENRPPPPSYIVNGTATFSFGATGALLKKRDDGAFAAHCSGAMIGCGTFLTARHCVADDLESSDYAVYLQGEGILEVDTILPEHPAYAGPFADLQLLRLSNPVTAVKPVPIVAAANASAGIPATITGFGHTQLNGNDHGIKRFGSVMTLACNVFDRTGEPLESEGFICWHFDGKMANTCNVDSGGPLFTGIVNDDGNLIGTASGGDLQCVGDYHSVDADLGYFSPWIEQTGGEDVGQLSCTLPGGESIESVEALADIASVTAAGAQKIYAPVVLDAATTEVRIALNAEDRLENDIDLRVELGTTRGRVLDTCDQDQPGNFSFCRFEIGEPGAVVSITVSQKGENSGSGKYQLLVSEIRQTGDRL